MFQLQIDSLGLKNNTGYDKKKCQEDCFKTDDHVSLMPISQIQLVVYYQYCVPIGWATSRLYVIAH